MKKYFLYKQMEQEENIIIISFNHIYQPLIWLLLPHKRSIKDSILFLLGFYYQVNFLHLVLEIKHILDILYGHNLFQLMVQIHYNLILNLSIFFNPLGYLPEYYKQIMKPIHNHVVAVVHQNLVQ
jgi:hypothetical protein